MSFSAGIPLIVDIQLELGVTGDKNTNKLKLDFDGKAKIKGTSLEAIRLRYSRDSSVKGNLENAPGSWNPSFNSIGPDIRNKAVSFSKNLIVKRRFAQKKISYIHTTSSLDIDKDPNWIASASHKEIVRHASFDEVVFDNRNSSHSEAKYRHKLIERVKEGPPC